MQNNAMLKENSVAVTLFCIVLVMLVPVVLNSLGVMTNFTISMVAAFVLICIIVFFKFPIFQQRLDSGSLLLLMLLICNSMFSIVVNSFNKLEINVLDFINVLVKSFNIYVLYLLPKYLSFSKCALSKYTKLMLMLSIIACLYNIIINISFLISGFLSFTSSYDVNFCSFFVNRNQFGMFLVVSIFIAEVYFGNNKYSKYKYCVLSLLFINLFFTFSRGSMISVAFFYIVRYFFNHNAKQNFLAFVKMVFFIFVLFILIFFYVPKFVEFLNTMVIRSDVGTSGRTEIWTMGLEVALHNIINGLGTFTGLDFAIKQGFEFGQFHSLYIDTLVGGGLIELSILFIIYGNVYRVTNKIYDANLRNTIKAFLLAVLLMGCNESVSFFSLGYVDIFFTVNCITLPFLISNFNMCEYKKISN